MPLLEVEDLKVAYRTPGGGIEPVLDVRSFHLETGEEVVLYGPSGTGKTTLLHCIAGIRRPDAGRVVLQGVDLCAASEAARDRLRATAVGYVFQGFHLLPAYSALENVLLGMAFGPGADRGRARALLERLDLGDRLRHRPGQLSTGQQQRVAVARALASRPALVLADEPTGNLDAQRSEEALRLLREVCREEGAALLVVSHEPDVIEGFDRRVSLADINRAGAA
jgi:putative ABC transport system ATP-binding protein